ncbi:hypothetical protein Tco_0084986 [Tanacetum coccineum]
MDEWETRLIQETHNHTTIPHLSSSSPKRLCHVIKPPQSSNQMDNEDVDDEVLSSDLLYWNERKLRRVLIG